ncbi:MAG: Wzz/FepE/Etk N-terminal domain-containing protein [Actinomycetes bacterium]
MDSVQFLNALKQRWKSLVVIILAAVALAAGLSLAASTSYQANARLFVAVTGEAAQSRNQGNLLASPDFLKAQLQSFVEFANTPEVIKAASAEAGSTVPAGSISATASPEAFVIDVTGSAGTAALAAARTNAAANQLAVYIPRLATHLPNGSPAFTATVIKPATVPASASSPRWTVNLVLGLLLGIAIGLAWVLIAGQVEIARSKSEAGA